jgi:hypothetical protein
LLIVGAGQAASLLARAMYVDTPGALAKSGDVLQAMAERAFSAGQLQGMLAERWRCQRLGLTAAEQVTAVQIGAHGTGRPCRC